MLWSINYEKRLHAIKVSSLFTLSDRIVLPQEGPADPITVTVTENCTDPTPSGMPLHTLRIDSETKFALAIKGNSITVYKLFKTGDADGVTMYGHDSNDGKK